MFREITRSHNEHLTNDLMMQSAPSVFAEQPYHEVSDKYGFIPTIQVVDALRNEGWLPVDATQKNVRTKDKREFTKHLVRFRRLGDDIQIGDSVVELLLTNSHDRSSGFILHAGIFRMACANGIVVADSTFNRVSVRHSKYAAGRVVEGSYQVIDEVPMIAGEVETMQAITLSDAEKYIFARAALQYALPAPTDNKSQIVTTEGELVRQALRPMRNDDHADDLWTTYNIVQEKIMRGGIRTMSQNQETGRYRRNSTREVKSIDKNIKLNKALWEMAVQMKQLKQAA